MEKDKIFFGKDGLTSTSANFLANIAKELYETTETSLENMVFYTTSVKLLSSTEYTIVKNGLDSVKGVEESMKFIAELKSLIAWLREAIKAKERLTKEVRDSSYEDYGIVLPERPSSPKYMTEDDYISTMNVKQRNRYYYLEAFCSTIGKYIHPSGKYAYERSELKKIISNPRNVVGSGRDTLIYTMKPSLPVEEVEDTFMKLQQTYRTYQAELNSIKYEISSAVEKDKALKDGEYNKKLNEYSNAMDVACSLLADCKNKALDEVSKLRIIIPDSLKSVYERVHGTGKEK